MNECCDTILVSTTHTGRLDGHYGLIHVEHFPTAVYKKLPVKGDTDADKMRFIHFNESDWIISDNYWTSGFDSRTAFVHSRTVGVSS